MGEAPTKQALECAEWRTETLVEVSWYILTAKAVVSIGELLVCARWFVGRPVEELRRARRGTGQPSARSHERHQSPKDRAAALEQKSFAMR